jgi:hypothetical protein
MRTSDFFLFALLAVLIYGLLFAAQLSAEPRIFESTSHSRDLALSRSVPAQLNYQGYLVDSSDSSAVTGTLEMTFKLFGAETDGTELWSETHTAVTVSNGTFQVFLGGLTSFPEGLFDGSELWLQTQVGTEILSPRKPLVSVAYSQTDGDWSVAGDDIFRMDGNVGIGRDDPITELDVLGHARIQGGLYVAQPGTNESLVNIYSSGISDWELVAAFDANRFDIREYNGIPSLSITAGGDVGIGTITPGARLDVNGSVTADTYYGDGSNLTGISGSTDDDWTIDGDDVYHQTGNVGIGTSSPGHPLDVSGAVQATTYYGDGSNLTGISGTTDNDWIIDGSNVYHETGNVGIGTTSPGHPLDVGGAVQATTYYGDGSNLTGISGTTDNDWAIDGNDVYHETGNVGIGTPSPAGKLDVQGTMVVGQDSSGYDVTFYGGGDYGGGRFFWDEDRMALRAGRDDDGTFWAPDSVGYLSFATGRSSKASGYSSIAMGEWTEARGEAAIAMGDGAIASEDHATAIGWEVTASGRFSTAIGWEATANGGYSTAIGHKVTAGPADNTIVLGSGLTSFPHTPLMNNIENSLMVGFETDEATLFVGGPDHRVGIGTSNPEHRLHVEGAASVEGLWLPGAMGPDASYVGGDGNWIAFGHPGISEDFLGYKGNTFYLMDSPGGGDVVHPDLVVGGAVNAVTYYGDGSNLTGISGTTDNDWTISGDDMYSSVSGNVGIGTLAPGAKLDIQGTVNIGADGTGYDVNFYGADNGGRFFWDEDKMALRVGRDAYGSYWHPDSIGLYSFATGSNTKASGYTSTAMGSFTTASGFLSTAMGTSTEASGDFSTAMNYYTVASGDYSTAMGASTEASGDFSTAMNGWSVASGDYSTTMGYNSVASGENSTAIGRYVTAGPADNTIVLGSGFSSFPNTPLINNIENSLMVGFETNEATLFVGGPDHQVGIGTSSPSSKLDVNGAVNATSPYHIAGNSVLSTEGTGNILVGIGAGANNTGADGTFLGAYAGNNNQGEDNTFLGSWAGYANTTGENNTFVGLGAGRYNTTGSNSTFIGYMAGFNETGSSKLYIDNSSTSSPLIWGDFENNRLVVNGNATNNTFNRTFFSNGSAGGTTAWQNDSDEDLKKNINTIPDALQKVQQLRGVNFEWKDAERHEPGRQMGFIAQEAVGIIPEVVLGQEGHYAMQYGPITALLVEAVKELSEENRELWQENKEMRGEIETIKAEIR